MNLSEDLVAGAAALGVPLDAAQQQKLLDYIALIVKWNKVYNLTAVRDPAAMVTQHLLDSLTVLPHLAGPHLIDVGCGAGFDTLLAANDVGPAGRVIAVDMTAEMRERAAEGSRALGFTHVDIRAGYAEELPVADGAAAGAPRDWNGRFEPAAFVS